MTPEEFLAAYPAPIVKLGEALRTLVRAQVPQTVEQVKTGWQLIGLHIPLGKRLGYYGFILPHADSISLGFQNGIALQDDERVLLGAAERLVHVRYVSLRHIADIDREPHGRFIREAAELLLMPREMRMALVALAHAPR